MKQQKGTKERYLAGTLIAGTILASFLFCGNAKAAPILTEDATSFSFDSGPLGPGGPSTLSFVDVPFSTFDGGGGFVFAALNVLPGQANLSIRVVDSGLTSYHFIYEDQFGGAALGDGVIDNNFDFPDPPLYDLTASYTGLKSLGEGFYSVENIHIEGRLVENSVPDEGSSLLLLGLGLITFFGWRRFHPTGRTA